ncbi:hypothetical protein D3C80_1007440 [compost metagenome]
MVVAGYGAHKGNEVLAPVCASNVMKLPKPAAKMFFSATVGPPTVILANAGVFTP